MHTSGPLTETPFLDLLRCQGKDGKYLSHYLDDDISHRRCDRKRGIDVEALGEIIDTFEELDKSIIA
jgi:hypothetical protein